MVVFLHVSFSSTGDGMTAYVAYKVSTRVCKIKDTFSPWILTWVTKLPVRPVLFAWIIYLPSCFSASIIMLSQSSLAMFKSKAFTVRRRYSDFLGLFEKLTVKQSLQGFIIPPAPEKSVVGEWWAIFYLSGCAGSCVFCFVLISSCDSPHEQEWPKWRWEWTTRPLWSLWREEELLWRGRSHTFFMQTH